MFRAFSALHSKILTVAEFLFFIHTNFLWGVLYKAHAEFCFDGISKHRLILVFEDAAAESAY